MKNIQRFNEHRESFNKYYKWTVDKDLYCAEVINSTTANYYKNGKLYAEFQQFTHKKNDIEITRSEFNGIIGLYNHHL